MKCPRPGRLVLRIRLAPDKLPRPLADVDNVIESRKNEADEFYEAIHPPKATAEEKLIQRQAFAGMLWGKQIYLFDVNRWLEGDNIAPPETHKKIRNIHWRSPELHASAFRARQVGVSLVRRMGPGLSVHDLSLVDPEFAKEISGRSCLSSFSIPTGRFLLTSGSSPI